MTLTEKLEYAKLRADGAALFARDEKESKQWQQAVKEIEAEIKKKEKK